MQFTLNTNLQNSTLQRSFGKRLLKLCLHMIKKMDLEIAAGKCDVKLNGLLQSN